MKALFVARREYVENVRRKSFIVTTVVVPVLMSLFFVLPVMFAMVEPQRQYRLAVVDQTGALAADFAAALTDTLKNGKEKYLPALVIARAGAFDAARDSCVSAVQAGDLHIVVAIPAGILSGEKAAYITRDERNLNVLERFEDALNDAVLKQRLTSEGLDYAHIRELTAGIELEMNQLTDEGGIEKRSFLFEYGLVVFFVLVLNSAILSWGLTIAKSIVEEKGSRIIEVLLSSLTARDLMLGKLVGVGLAGLTQLLIWATVGLALTGSALPTLLAQFGPMHIPPLVFVYFVVYFVLGFLLFAALFMMVGAVSSTEQDAQQMQAMVTLPMIIPIMSLMLIIQNPNSGLAIAMSLFPVFTPLLMQARIVMVMPPAWQIALSIGLMVLTIFFAVSFAARVFRVGILMHGKRPSLRELVHWYRMAG